MANPIVGKLRQKNRKTVTIKDEEIGEAKFIVRALSTYELSEHKEAFEKLPTKEVDPDTLDDQGKMQFANDVLFPMMKAVLPACCLDPKVTNDFEHKGLQDPNSNVIHLSEIPINIAAQVFNEILALSGLTKKAEEARKNSPTQQSPSP